ncbi:C45 family peptidase [Alterisphingorhabdus coralli]|uniref:C45 family peptidase n=1 Tax=Alterisphingorhabdus coralli TaxID=3071408 RepID=A0AA97F903_9SPHN|nr:C45 family peptidase [Parasphingorhabdus sp. SCSIO 66989]WOE75487.1 C45 family peptidase [Parasphingorhabdus sp. SCSIO 66989]
MLELSVSGSARERGLQHGEALRAEIAEHLDRWFHSIETDLKTDPKAYLREFLESTDFLPAIDKWTPELLQEVEGIAEAANQPFDLIFARQLSDEEPWHRREVKMSAAGFEGCSSVGARQKAGEETIIAQNMDVAQWCDGLQLLLHIRYPDGLQVMQFTLPGKINLAGMNSAGIGICCNTLSQLDYSRTGLPEDFVVRGVLERRTLEDALSFLESIPHASGQNYTLAGPGTAAINLECSAKSVARYVPDFSTDLVYHTNHPLANTDRETMDSWTRDMTEAQLRQYYFGTSLERFPAMTTFLSNLKGPPDAEDMKALLSLREGGVSRRGDAHTQNDNLTLGCLIMHLSESPFMEIAPGPPCQTPFGRFEFAR